MIIRRAKKEDSAMIVALMKQLIDEHRGLDSYYKEFSYYQELPEYITETIKDHNKLLLIAEENDKVVAYFIGAIEEAPYYSSEKKIGVVADTCVDKKYRRSGILEKLFQEALTWFDSKKINYIELSGDARNSAAVSAWKKLGFADYKLRLRRKRDL